MPLEEFVTWYLDADDLVNLDSTQPSTCLLGDEGRPRTWLPETMRIPSSQAQILEAMPFYREENDESARAMLVEGTIDYFDTLKAMHPDTIICYHDW